MSNCLGCEQASNNNDRDFETAKTSAIEYAKENKISLRIYKEIQEWKFISLEFAKSNSIYGREDIYYDERTSSVQFQKMSL